jgi:hypothetical protein
MSSRTNVTNGGMRMRSRGKRRVRRRCLREVRPSVAATASGRGLEAGESFFLPDIKFARAFHWLQCISRLSFTGRLCS